MQDKARNPERPECLDRRILGEYASGQLEEPQLGECEAHLDECDQCEETVRGMFDTGTDHDSISQLALEALQNRKERQTSDAPLVDQLIRDLSSKTPDPDRAARALENRAAEVTRLLPAPASSSGSSSTSDEADAIGCIGNYEVQRLLGAGSTGIVYEAKDTKLQRQVALKVLRPSLGDTARDRFMNEARAAAAISHPNVITIYQVGVEGPLAYIAMELSAGQTLESRLAEVAFVAEDKVTQIARQVADGLAAAHRHGLIHRDIKPANVWLKAGSDDAIILDFGLARIADDDPQMTATGMLAGTPNFMSPEQTRGLELDGRSDLFSLGCLMYRASTGKLPFGSTGILATLQSIQNDEPRAPKLMNPHLSDDFSDLVMALLEKQPANRPESADQVINALESERSNWPFPVSSYGDQATDSSPRPALSPAVKSGGFSGWRWVTTALLLIGMGGLGWFFAPQIIRIATDQGELVIDAKDEAVEVEVLRGGDVVRVIDTKTDQSIDIEAGEYRVQLKDSKNGLKLSSDGVVLTRGGQAIVSVTRGEVARVFESQSQRNARASSDQVSSGKFDFHHAHVAESLKRLVVGLQSYESAIGRFPPIGNRDPSGKLLLSWRVHILPFIGHQKLYSKFHVDEPWDSPHNLPLLKEMPTVYSVWADPTHSRLGKTRVLAPVGDGLIMDPDSDRVGKGARYGDIYDGSANTMLFVLVGEHLAVEWTKPQDWNFDESTAILDLVNRHQRTYYATCSGVVSDLKFPISSQFAKALVTRAGGETIDFDNQTATATVAATSNSSDMEMYMYEDGAGFGGFDEEYGSAVNPGDQSLYAGKTFEQWMQVVKNDRQMKAKFDALAAVAELAQGDDDRKKLVMDQIKPLLRKYGANYIDGSVVFSQGKYVGLVTDNVRNSQLTHLFIELLQRFSKDDVMELVVDEIRHGTTNSRKFLSLLWSPGTVWSEDPPNQMKHLQAIDRHAFEIASSVLDTIDACDDASRSAMVGTISSVGKIATLKLDPDQDPLMQLHGGRSARKPLSEISDGWKDLITNAFESDQPTQGAIVAVSMVRLFPERANLAEDLVELLADETLQPELRAAGLEALAELPPKRIEPVAGTLLALGKQTEPELLDRTKTTSMYRVDNGGGGFGFCAVSIDVRIGLLLTELEEPPEGLVPWLKELSAEFAEMGQGIANPSSNRVKQVLDRAIERITGEPAKPPTAFGAGATKISNSDSRPHPLYEGRTFNQWMQSLKSERQLKAKFNALAAVAELAQGDDDREKLVMDQIKPLLRKHGSREMEGGDPFQNESNGGTLKNTFRNGELTHLFIEILRRFTADDLMELAIDEIKNGTANSREFLTWVWMAHEMRGSDPPGQLEYLRAIDWRSVEIATAVLETAGSCEANSRVAMIDIITALDGVVAMDLGPEVNASTLYFDGTKRSLDEMPEQWKLLLTNAFESNDLTQKGCVAVTMAKAFPSRKELAKDLVDMLIDTNTPTEIRAASLHALEELPLEKIEPVADRLLSFGKQAGPAKEQLITLTKSQYYYVSTGNACGYRGGSANGVDANVRVAFMLSQLGEPSEQLLPWLEELLTKAQADPGRARFGGTDQAVENTKQVLAEAIQRVTGEPLKEAETSPAGGVF